MARDADCGRGRQRCESGICRKSDAQVIADEDGRSTIAIQHAGQMVTEYGNVADPAVRADDWVLAGQRIGVIPEPKDAGGQSLLLFAVKRSGEYIDPSEVVPFD